ncbi:MAG: penicillin acylase family protein [Acidobacteria bacterium]|nr:penicillin acylase family protein [Acidobacteriota bacterium]
MKRVLLFACLLLPIPILAQDSTPKDLAAAAHKALAVISGKLNAKGLEKPVEVLRDRWGVAHIYAQNQHDLFFAQGFVAAQDRLFQMELWKRAGQGRLAEVLGPAFLARDVNARLLRYRGDMKAEYESYAPDTLAILTAFTDGINAYIASLANSGSHGLPVEFQLAGFSPDPWHPEDCLNRMAAFSMTGNAFSELEHAQAVSLMGADKASLLFQFDPEVTLDPAPGADFEGLASSLLQNLVGSDHRIEFPARVPQGSNNWTVSGALTYSGKPMLANDPHRVIGLPSLRYMVHLVAPGWNVAGAGEPGLPGVALGHNEHIAWGFTIFGLDQQDLYLEELNPADPLQYKTETGWQPMEVLHEKFGVRKAISPDEMRNDIVRDPKDPSSVDIALNFTRHGPVLWDNGKRAIALRWVGSEPGTAGYLASLAIDRAEDWDQFESAVARWKVPSENLVYADTSGNIGEHSAGLAPIRKWTGLLPVPGNSGFEWTGFVPVNELPHFFNPKEGFIATANHKMIPDHYPYNVGFEWASPYRINRINWMFENAKEQNHKITLPDMAFLQNDITSLAAIEFQKLLRSTPLIDEPSLHKFFAWDAELERKSTEAALYEVWLDQIRNALADRFKKDRGAAQILSTHYKDLSPDAIFKILKTPDPNANRSAGDPPAPKPTKSATEDALALFGPNPGPERNQLLYDTLKSARAELEKLLGPDSAEWTWGALHVVHFRHALDQQPGAKSLFDLGPLARPGDEYTPNATATSDSWEQVSGASYRQIIDLSNWDRSWVVNTPGQSGQPGSPHYSDLLPLWDAGRYFPLLYSKKAVDGETTNRLTLEP